MPLIAYVESNADLPLNIGFYHIFEICDSDLSVELDICWREGLGFLEGIILASEVSSIIHLMEDKTKYLLVGDKPHSSFIGSSDCWYHAWTSTETLVLFIEISEEDFAGLLLRL